MTQLVAAICDQGRKIIALSDRMVTTGDMTLGFEHEERKMYILTEKAIILLAGTIHEPDLITDIKNSINPKHSVRDIANVAKTKYQSLRDTLIIDEILRRYGLKSFDDFHNKQKILHDGIVLEINDQVKKYFLPLDLLLVGLDGQGSHIIHISNPGIWKSYDPLAYCCLGMGDRHAENVFAWYRYSQNLNLNEALYISFEAKKKSEMASGVGNITDALIIDQDGTKEVKEETMNELQEAYYERERQAERRGFDRKITELKIQTNTVEIN